MVRTKDVGWRWITVDSLVCARPCYLLTVLITTSAAGAGTVTIRNGHNTGAEAALVLGSVASHSTLIDLAEGIFLHKGLYVDLGSNVTGVLVRYLSEDAHVG